MTNDVTLIEPGRTQYTLCLNDDGGIVDDLLVWQWDEEFYWVLPNASTHAAIMEGSPRTFPAVEIEDLRPATAMVAVQGPAAPAALEEAIGILPKRFRDLSGVPGSCAGPSGRDRLHRANGAGSS